MKTVACSLVVCLWLAAHTDLSFADDEQPSDLIVDSAWFASQSNNAEKSWEALSLDEQQEANHKHKGHKHHKHKPHKAPAPIPASPEAPTPSSPPEKAATPSPLIAGSAWFDSQPNNAEESWEAQPLDEQQEANHKHHKPLKAPAPKAPTPTSPEAPTPSSPPKNAPEAPTPKAPSSPDHEHKHKHHKHRKAPKSPSEPAPARAMTPHP